MTLPATSTGETGITGSDDLGAYIDTGVSRVPAAHAVTTTDIRALVPALAAAVTDSGVSAAHAPAVPTPSATRPTTQRR